VHERSLLAEERYTGRHACSRLLYRSSARDQGMWSRTGSVRGTATRHPSRSRMAPIVTIVMCHRHRHPALLSICQPFRMPALHSTDIQRYNRLPRRRDTVAGRRAALPSLSRYLHLVMSVSLGSDPKQSFGDRVPKQSLGTRAEIGRHPATRRYNRPARRGDTAAGRTATLPSFPGSEAELTPSFPKLCLGTHIPKLCFDSPVSRTVDQLG
jgi:hypothetical protein